MKVPVFHRRLRFCMTDRLAQEAAEGGRSLVVTWEGMEAMTTDHRNNGAKTQAIMPVGRPFKPGNPGRPRDSRNKLGEAFLEALNADWQEHGAEAIARVRQDRPQDYVKVVASTLPKDLQVSDGRTNDPRQLSDEDLTAVILNGKGQ